MPPTIRTRILRQLDQASLANSLITLLSESDLDSSLSSEVFSTDKTSPDDDLLSSLMIRCYVECTRYLSPRIFVPKSKHFVEEIIFNLDDRRFCVFTRMSRDSFFRLVGMISGHEIFFNYSYKRQASPAIQLLIALYRFGNFGNGSGQMKAAAVFGVSEGAVEIYTRRILVAILALEPQYVTWPSELERAKMKKRIKYKHGFPNCISLIDGPTIVLYAKPAADGHSYFTRLQTCGNDCLQ